MWSWRLDSRRPYDVREPACVTSEGALDPALLETIDAYFVSNGIGDGLKLRGEDKNSDFDVDDTMGEGQVDVDGKDGVDGKVDVDGRP